MEIERKFLIDKLPDLTPKAHKTVWQGYLYTQPHVVRIRKTENADGSQKFILCIKSGQGLVRHEVETLLSAEQFEELASLLDKPLIKKDFYEYDIPGNLVLECSIVDDGVFSYAEVEFDSREEAEAWEPLDCLGKELTYYKGFSMAEYWENRSIPDFE